MNENQSNLVIKFWSKGLVGKLVLLILLPITLTYLIWNSNWQRAYKWLATLLLFLSIYTPALLNSDQAKQVAERENLKKQANTVNLKPTQETKQSTGDKTQEVGTKKDTPSQDAISKAQVELDDLMTLSKKAGLVSSYEFSEYKTLVYADKVWYTQKVNFKKDFLAKVAMLKQTITGYRHFEVRDAYTDEKVAEVKAFGGELKVYK